MLKTDPTIEAIRAVRHDISRECGNDPKRLIAHYMKMQREMKNVRFVSGPEASKHEPPSLNDPAPINSND